MVQFYGHLAMALLWAAPAWILWDGRTSIAFVAFVLSTALLPDVDLALRTVLPTVHHHGVTHTVVFVVAVSAMAGLLAVAVVAPTLKRWWWHSEGQAVSRGTIYLFVTGGMLLGGFSHLFADVLSAPDIAQPIEPLWPFFDGPVSLDVIYYTSPWWNLGLFLVALSVHAVLAYLDPFPIRHRYRPRGRNSG